MIMARSELRELTPEEQDIVAKCKVLGVDVAHPADFISYSYRAGVPMPEVVAKLYASELERDHDKNLIAIMMQAGAVPQFREIMLPAIVKVMLREGDNHTTGFAINALGEIVLPADSALVAELLLTKKIGGKRILLISTYTRIAKKTAIPVLRKLVLDQDTRAYALKALAKLGDISIEHELRELLKSPESFHREIARAALKQVEKRKLKFHPVNLQ